ncbi:MAG: hypothetical protein ACYDBQ_02800 [Thermoplasmatota archaeon]
MVLGFVAIVALILLLVLLFLVPTFQARKAGRTGWWIYLICAFIGPLNIAALIAWFAYFKKNPTKLGSSDLTL